MRFTLQIPDSRFPIPDSRFPIPDSRFPIPDSRFPIPDFWNNSSRDHPVFLNCKSNLENIRAIFQASSPPRW
ncbi:MAG: hypothetical protein F6K53_35975 [Moorea sp. SIO4A1]|uniref:hypothetical protein n=1 Tax=Moorena sp. SIO4A1 TaxID=2607835 RepID=UPI00144F15D4|nr:hypothetical protein [Moorena sp. SIO4A1]NEQ62496.1 hypothetical protein [Moorena sp. SIO4A1]